jgi:flagellar basal-body rod protein FlgC
MFDTRDVVAHALSATRTRMNTLASNIANADTTRTPEGGAYKPRHVVQVAHSVKSKFSSALDRMSLYKPQVEAVVADGSSPKMVFEPAHPDANEQGFVAYPNVNVVETMTNMMSATRLYQSNVEAMKALTEMEQKAAQISIRF